MVIVINFFQRFPLTLNFLIKWNIWKDFDIIIIPRAILWVSFFPQFRPSGYLYFYIKSPIFMDPYPHSTYMALGDARYYLILHKPHLIPVDPDKVDLLEVDHRVAEVITPPVLAPWTLASLCNISMHRLKKTEKGSILRNELALSLSSNSCQIIASKAVS